MWPFHLSPTVGYAIGGAVVVFGTLDSVVKLIRGPRKKALTAS